LEQPARDVDVIVAERSRVIHLGNLFVVHPVSIDTVMIVRIITGQGDEGTSTPFKPLSPRLCGPPETIESRGVEPNLHPTTIL